MMVTCFIHKTVPYQNDAVHFNRKRPVFLYWCPIKKYANQTDPCSIKKPLSVIASVITTLVFIHDSCRQGQQIGLDLRSCVIFLCGHFEMVQTCTVAMFLWTVVTQGLHSDTFALRWWDMAMRSCFRIYNSTPFHIKDSNLTWWVILFRYVK